MGRVWFVVTVALGIAIPSIYFNQIKGIEPEPPPVLWTCRDIGAFRYAVNLNNESSKVVTTVGQYVVWGMVSGDHGTMVQFCERQRQRGNGYDREIRIGTFANRVRQ